MAKEAVKALTLASLALAEVGEGTLCLNTAKGIIPLVQLGLEPYRTKKGAEGYNLVSLGSAFEGELLGKTSDGMVIRMKGGIYAKKALEKPEAEERKQVGKVLTA